MFRFARGKDGDFDALRLATEAKAQEVNIVRLSHAAFLLVDLEPHALLQKSPDRCHDALTGAFAPHEDIAIVGVSDEPETTSRQFAVQLVKFHVGQQRRERAAPCGVPSWTATLVPSGITTAAFSIRRMRLTIRWSVTRSAIRASRR